MVDEKAITKENMAAVMSELITTIDREQDLRPIALKVRESFEESNEFAEVISYYANHVHNNPTIHVFSQALVDIACEFVIVGWKLRANAETNEMLSKMFEEPNGGLSRKS